MAKVTPFRGWRYNPAMVDDMAAVLCPPYDLITPQIQQALMDKHPLNVIHLEAGEGLDWAADPAGRYAETSERFGQWLRDGVLQQDAEPGFYLLRHGFTLGGRERSRLGLIACVGLEDYETRQVLPHEFTEAPAIRDRVTLMESVSANISPIMSIYRDADNDLGPVFQRVMAGKPEVDAKDEYDTVTTMWRISDSEDVAAITSFFTERPVFLADGHHRYEASRQYQIARHAEGADAPSKAHNYVMMTLISFDDPGLVVLPYHRNLSGLSDVQLARVQARISELFDSEPAPIRHSRESGNPAAELVELVEQRGHTERVMAALGPDGAQLLTLRPDAIGRRLGRNGRFRSLGAGRKNPAPGAGRRHAVPSRLPARPRRSGGGRRQRLPANGLPDEALPYGRLRGHRGPRTASPPQVHLLLPQAAHRPGHQPH